MRPLAVRIFVVGSLIWMTASVIDIARNASTKSVLTEYLGLTVLGFVVIFLIAFCTQWLVDCLDRLRYGSIEADKHREGASNGRKKLLQNARPFAEPSR
jgi:hypothetical protein